MQSFIRVYYGITDLNNKSNLIKRHEKVKNDINRIKNSKYKIPFLTYCMGVDNYEYIKSEGFDCVKVCDEPYKYDLTKNQYRNKMELIKIALEDFNEVTYLDWDVYLQKELPQNYWELCRQKELLQGCLQNYRHIKCNWRREGRRTLLNGGFLYIGNKIIMEQAINFYDTKFNNQPNDELAYTYLIDYINNGFDLNKIIKNYESLFCRLYKNYVVKKEDTPFLHIFGRGN